MALSQRLEFRQSQALVMTPQLMQAIKLLQLSSLDLAAYVEGELERNPLLERAEADDTPAQGAELKAPCRARRGFNATSDWIGEDLETSRSSMEQGLGTELENVFPDDGGEENLSRRNPRRRPTPSGPVRAPAARTATITWKPSSRPRSRSPITLPNRWRSPSRPGSPHDRAIPDRHGDDAGYLTAISRRSPKNLARR